MNDAGFAVRSLRKQSGFTALALLTLALGVGATTTAFAVLDTVLLRPLPYAHSERLVLLRERTKTGDVQSPSYPNFADWRERTHSFSGVASEQYPWAQTVTVGTDVTRAVVMGVSRGFFSVLGVSPAVGRELTAAENRAGGSPALMVSYDFWQSHMGGRLPLGSILFGSGPLPVVGVLPRGFRFVDDADIYFPHEIWPGTCRSCRNYRVFGRLAPGATRATSQAEMTTLSRALLATYGKETSAVDAGVTPLRDYLVGRYDLMLTVVLAAAALVLLVACTNLVSAQLARGLMRGREMAVRTALGATRGRLVRQLFLESSILAIGGAALGALVAVIFTRVVRTLGAGLVPRLDELRVDGGILLFTAGLSVVTAVLIGLYPAFRLSRIAPGHQLRGARGSSGTVRASVWRLLVGFEIAMAIVLLVGSALLIRTMHNILTADTGFDANGIVTASLVPNDTVDMARLAQLGADLAAVPGVKGVAFANHVPLDWGSTAGPVRRTTDPADHDFPAMAGFRLVTPEYFGVMQQPVLRGRSIAAGDREGTPAVAIITPGIAKTLWPGQDPIGQRIVTNYLFGQALTVVGVVAEASSWTMPRGEQNEIYVPLAQHPARTQGELIAFLRTARDPAAIIPAVRARLHDVAPAMPPQLGTLSERIARSAADRKFAMVALTLFGGIALVLAGIGIYGTMSYTVAARTHEIGVRLALGATPFQVKKRVLTDAASMALGGIAVGAVAGLFATRYLQATLYGVSRADPLAYVGGAAVLLLTALLGAYVPSHRSSRVDPLQALRAD
jgi:putative ABC transport system permease protein